LNIGGLKTVRHFPPFKSYNQETDTAITAVSRG